MHNAVAALQSRTDKVADAAFLLASSFEWKKILFSCEVEREQRGQESLLGHGR